MHERKKIFQKNLPQVELLHGGILQNVSTQRAVFEKIRIPTNGVTFSHSGEITLLRDRDGVIFPPVQVWRQAGTMS